MNVFDTNQTSTLDQGDEYWPEFSIWYDINEDGKFDTDEISSLDELGVKSISLEYLQDSESYTAADGEVLISGQTLVSFDDGSITTAEDVSFASTYSDGNDLSISDNISDLSANNQDISSSIETNIPNLIDNYVSSLDINDYDELLDELNTDDLAVLDQDKNSIMPNDEDILEPDDIDIDIDIDIDVVVDVDMISTFGSSLMEINDELTFNDDYSG